MLWGLPFSNVLGLCSRHSCSSSPGSGPPKSSYTWVSSCSSGPTSFSCEPVWCTCAHEWSARCPGCNAYASGYQMTMTWCIVDIGVQCLCKWVPDDHDMVYRWHRWSFLQGSQHHPRTCNQIKHLLHSLLQVAFMVNQQTNMTLQRYTKHHFILFNLCITIHNLFIHF